MSTWQYVVIGVGVAAVVLIWVGIWLDKKYQRRIKAEKEIQEREFEIVRLHFVEYFNAYDVSFTWEFDERDSIWFGRTSPQPSGIYLELRQWRWGAFGQFSAYLTWSDGTEAKGEVHDQLRSQLTGGGRLMAEYFGELNVLGAEVSDVVAHYVAVLALYEEIWPKTEFFRKSLVTSERNFKEVQKDALEGVAGLVNEHLPKPSSTVSA